MDEQPDSIPHTKRDGETMLMLGGFMSFISLPVMIGTIWAGSGFEKAINLGCGATLLAIGLGFIFRGRHILKNID